MGKKGSKRKAQEQTAVEEVDGAQEEALRKSRATEEAEGGAPANTKGAERRRSAISVVGDETSTYLSEVMAHFQTLVEDEERQLLVANVMEEIAGKEQKAAADPVCSRHIEALLSVAQASQLTAFLSSIMDTGGLFELAVR
eukprot:1157024-Pelagomonas_calceolata.AAC.1